MHPQATSLFRRGALALALFAAATAALAGSLSPEGVAVRDRWGEVTYRVPPRP